MATTQQQLICSRPFEWFEVHPDGSAFLCCPAWLKRPIGNLLQQSIEDIWNGPIAQEVRKSILNGSFHNCSRQRCPHLLNQTEPVGRPKGFVDPQVQKAVSASLSRLPYLPKKLNLCFDLSCNLGCPSCRREKQMAGGAELERAQKIKALLLDKLIPHTEVITLSGFGDPFGSPTYMDLLKQLNQGYFPRLQQIRLHSNGQLLTRKLWQSLPNLHPLISEIEVSIDAATEETYHLNRPSGSFAQLLNNLEFLGKTSARLTLSMVIQQNNWRELPLLVELAQNYGAAIYLSQLVNWGTFTQEEYKQRAVHLPDHPEHQPVTQLLESISKAHSINSNLSFLSATKQQL